jgi:Flp pilus assembly pilin Flp
MKREKKPMTESKHASSSEAHKATKNRRCNVIHRKLLMIVTDDRGEDIAEYAVMLAVILVIVIGTIRLIGQNAQNVFSQVASQVGGASQ